MSHGHVIYIFSLGGTAMAKPLASESANRPDVL